MKATFLRTVFALIGSFIFGGHALAGPLNNWHWRNPLPNGNFQSSSVTVTLNAIIFTNGEFYAVGSGGLLEVSPDGTNWTTWATATTNGLNDIICANGEFMAVGYVGTVETSSDGTNWVLQNSGTTAVLDSVAYGNGKFAAVGDAVIASADGIHWSPAVSGLTSSPQVAGGPTGFVAISTSNQDCFSTDGLHWSANTFTVPVTGFSGEPLQIQTLTYADGQFLIGSYIYATSASADMFMFSSTDGQNWKTNALGNIDTSDQGFDYLFFLTGNNEAIAAGQAEDKPFLQYSSDGVNWYQTNISVFFPFSSAGAYGNGTYVIIGAYGEYVTANITSSWTNETITLFASGPTGPANSCTSIADSNGTYVAASSGGFVVSTNDSVYSVVSNTPALSAVVSSSVGFVGVGSSGQLYASADGFTWTQYSSGTTSNLRSVAAASSLLVAVGDNGAVQTSASGRAWTSRTSGTSLGLYGVAYSNSLYVAVGQQGTVVTSPDGINWTVQYSGTLSNLTAVTYGWEGFLAVGAGGTIITSPDGVNWTQQNAGTSASLSSATFGDGYYLITGPNALVLTSPDGVNWTSRNVGATLGQNLYGSGFLNGRFDVVGSGGTILESDPVSPLFDIEIHNPPQQDVFTVFVTPGSTFRIQSCTNLANPTWSTVATFNNAAGVTQWTNTVTGLNPCFFRAISP